MSKLDELSDFGTIKEELLLQRYKVKELEEELRKRDWVDITKELPEDAEFVLLCTKYNEICIGRREYCESDNSDMWISDEGLLIISVTHWMELPEAPKEDSN